ncbi:MAG: exopolysaccharide biosynthesis protein [Tistlia sp.]|uniref:exopolysaccharide biosynthesis protein n=1 Tax=Tistlia sp. TaxID=3057121 RepID=UPI0034A250FF
MTGIDSKKGGESEAESLHDLVQQLVDNTEGEKVEFGELLEAVGMQAFGPLLLVPSLIAALPVVGAIPGISIVTGSVVALIAVQVLFGRRKPWLPRKLTGFSFKREPLVKGVEWAEPKLRVIDRFIRPRRTYLVHGPARYAIALAAIFNALLFYPAALLPFAVTAPALTVAVLAVGVTTTDGNWVIAGYLLTAASAGLIAYLSFSGLIPL